MKKIILLLLISVTTFGQKKPEDFGYILERIDAELNGLF